MLADILVPFATIALAEMGDKTQLAVFALATRHKHHLQIFLGSALASILADGSAVVLGSYLAKYVPRTQVTVAAGVLFISFGLYSLLKRGDGTEKAAHMSKHSVFIAAFLLFFLSEFGDKTQLTALLFGTQYNLFLTLIGVLSAMATLIALALLAGKLVKDRVNEKIIHTLSAVLFIVIGLFTLLKVLKG